MDLGITSRKALLNGASRGLGKACAVALAQEGADVTIVARTRDVLEQTCDEIRATTGVDVVPVVGDITTEAGRKAAITACPSPTSCSTTPTVRCPAISVIGPAMIGLARSTP